MPNAPLHDDCTRLIGRGHEPTQVVELARWLQFPDLLSNAFPNMPSFLRSRVYAASVDVQQNAHGDWVLTERA